MNNDKQVRDLNGTGTQFDRATVTITVQSVNQHKPKFTVPSVSNATVRVAENAEEEAFLVLVLQAEDDDPGDNGLVSYHIRVGEQLVQETAEFHVDSVSGELRTRMTLDRETKATYELLLVAKDGGLQTSYETLRLLTVIVDDRNDNQPEFRPERRSQVAPYHFRIEENVRPDTAVGQVHATDPDTGINAKVYYHILEGDISFHFISLFYNDFIFIYFYYFILFLFIFIIFFYFSSSFIYSHDLLFIWLFISFRCYLFSYLFYYLLFIQIIDYLFKIFIIHLIIYHSFKLFV